MTSTKNRPGEIWWEYRGERHRVVFIEYIDRIPVTVVTELHWDYSRKPWFQPGRDQASGTSAYYWDFDHSKRDRDTYYHNSGQGGDPLSISICRFCHPDPPPALLWIAPEVKLHCWASESRPEVPIRSDAKLLSMGYRRIGRPLLLSGNEWFLSKRSRNPFLVCSETDSSLVYCKECNDRFPSDAECEHLEWCDECCCHVYVDTHVREDEPDGEPVVHDEPTEDDDQ